jgi:hypothetical protein
MIIIGCRPSRIFCRVLGCLTPVTIDVVVVGSLGVPEGSFYPQPVNRLPRALVPEDRRFPNTPVWFDVLGGGELSYVEPTDDES